MKSLFAFCIIAVFTSLSIIMPVNGEATGVDGINESPDFIITEICADCYGKGTGGWQGDEDCAEFIELYNNSGRILDLYDYCVVYNPFGREDRYFENAYIEITPIKPGNFLDGSTLMFSGETHRLSDLSNAPINPTICEIQPEEIVVLWFVTCENWFADYNDGKGISMDDFRLFWQIPEDVKVVAVDANGSSEYGGNEKNFNINNTGVTTYGIALMSETLDEYANKRGSIYQTEYVAEKSLVCWATVDYVNQIERSIPPNSSFTFLYDKNGIAASDVTYVGVKPYKLDTRRHMLLSAGSHEVTCGALTTVQKMMLGVKLESGERAGFTDIDGMYIPNTGKGDFTGYVINGTLFRPGTSFISNTAGIYSLELKYDNDFIVYNHTVDSGAASPSPINPVTAGETTLDETKNEFSVTSEAPNSINTGDNNTKNSDSDNIGTGIQIGHIGNGNSKALQAVLIVSIILCSAAAVVLLVIGYRKRRNEE